MWFEKEKEEQINHMTYAVCPHDSLGQNAVLPRWMHEWIAIEIDKCQMMLKSGGPNAIVLSEKIELEEDGTIDGRKLKVGDQINFMAVMCDVEQIDENGFRVSFPAKKMLDNLKSKFPEVFQKDYDTPR
jgi:hypothetical protein